MGTGGSIALLVIGAILVFAVKDTDLGGWLDIDVVGWTLILAGLAGLVLTLWVWNSRRHRVVTVRRQAPVGATERYTTPDGQVVERRSPETERNY